MNENELIQFTESIMEILRDCYKEAHPNCTLSLIINPRFMTIHAFRHEYRHIEEGEKEKIYARMVNVVDIEKQANGEWIQHPCSTETVDLGSVDGDYM